MGSSEVIFVALKKVFGNFRYLLLAGGVAVLALVFFVWLPNLGLIFSALKSNSLDFAEKLKLLIGFTASIKTNFTSFSLLFTIFISLLFGINVSMLVYYFKERAGAVRESGVVAGLGGFLSGMLGVGCAACGTFILTSLLSTFGAAGALALLPFGGLEFGVLGVALLGISIVSLSKKIEKPLACD